MTDEDIERIIKCFGDSAAAGIEAGYQAVELHGAHGYLLTSFMSPLTNERNDKWGGDEQRRLEFPKRVIAAVRAAIGDRPLIYRISADEFAPKGLNVEDTARIAQAIVAAGADALHVSLGLGWTGLENVIEPSSQPEGWRLPYTRRIKQAVSVPIITVGQIRWPQKAEDAIKNGDCDMVALGRPLLADPDWAVKAASGRVDELRPCTSCNYCVALSMPADGKIGCAENPRAGHELDSLLIAPRRGEKAVVVGAGPGGMAAALLLDQAGYDTELIEARKTLGGGLIASAAPPHKDKLAWYQHYLERRLAASPIKLTLGTTADAATVAARKPAVVFIASGRSTPVFPIEGGKTAIVHDAYELLMGDDAWIGKLGPGPILVYGGGETGCETAEYLTERGRDVVLVSRSSLKDLARTAEFIYRTVLLRRLKANTHLRILSDTTLVRVDGNEAILRAASGAETREHVAAVLVAQGRTTDTSLMIELETKGLNVKVIGDARTGGRIGDAVRDAYEAVTTLTKPPRAEPKLGQLAC
jgi:thioredoxin reductase